MKQERGSKLQGLEERIISSTSLLLAVQSFTAIPYKQFLVTEKLYQGPELKQPMLFVQELTIKIKHCYHRIFKTAYEVGGNSPILEMRTLELKVIK